MKALEFLTTEQEVAPAVKAKEFLSGPSPFKGGKPEGGAGGEFPDETAWWHGPLEWITGGHVSYEPEPPKEVMMHPVSGEPIIAEPPSARMGFFEEPTGAPLMALFGGAALPAKTVGGHIARGIREGVGWLTGGASEAPALAKGVVKGGPKIVKGLEAKQLEKTMAKAVQKPLGQVPARVAAETMPGAVAAAPVRASEFLKGEFQERFIQKAQPKAKPKIKVVGKPKPALKPKPQAPKAKPAIKALTEDERLIRNTAEALKAEGATTLYSGIPIHKAGAIWTKRVGEPVWDKLVMQKVPKLLEKVPGGKAVNRLLLYEYRGNLPNTPGYIKSLEDMKRYQATGREYAIDLGKRLQALPEPSQLRVGEFIRGEHVTLTKPEQAIGEEAKRALYDLGKQAVDVGLLDEKVFFKNAGRYMPRLYTSKEYQTLLTRWSLTKPNRLDLSRFKRRKDIPKAIREKMGEILTPGYPVAKGITQLTHDLEMARFFSGVAQNKEWALPKGTKAAIPKGFKQLPANKRLGTLSESYVHPEIFKDLQETVRVMSEGEKFWRKSLGAWKFGKVILSPKTHVRNLMSNSVLAHLGGMPMYEQPVYLTRAAVEMKQQGKYWNMAMKEGFLKRTFTNAELRGLFDEVQIHMGGIRAGSIPEALGKVGQGWSKSKAVMNKAAKLYEAEEQWFKMAKFIHNIERRKMSVKAAGKDAEKWLFNYAKVTKFQEKYRSKWYGAPFATFTFKALPRIVEAMVKTPWRFALPGAMIYGLEQAAQRKIGDTPEVIKAKKALRPEWQKGQMLGTPNFARVPIIDEDGREHYLNLTYILPWGDLAEAGGFGPIPGGLMPFSQPFVKEPFSQIMNYDPFWKEQIVKEENLAGKTKLRKLATQAKLRGKHVAQAMLPTPFMDVQKALSAVTEKPDYRGRIRLRSVVALDVLAGIKMYPVDYAEQAQRQISKLHPAKGFLAKKIRSQIKTLTIKKNAWAKRGKDTSIYDKQIGEKILQLHGLAKEVEKIGKAFEKLPKKKKAKPFQ